jgi:tRNA (cmo5U34)-methyltransferase
MSSSKDKIYQRPLDKIADFAFDDKVAAVFPDMIQRSVPGYSTIIAMTGVLAGRYAKSNTHCYDLGCSLGASLLAMATHINKPDAKNNINIIGVDNSPAMLERCKILSQPFHNITLHCEDIKNTAINNASVVVMNFTLQFIASESRAQMLKKIYDGMHKGGILVLSEKIVFSDSHLNQLNIDMHHEFKKANGYSELEISQKRSALENVLIPETLETHHQRLKNIGFTHCDVWFQCFNFASLVAIK